MSTPFTPGTANEALLVIASGCAHCPAMIATLSQMVKEGKLARLTIINISEDPDTAARYRVRSVPWSQIGAVQFTGVKSREEILQLLAQQQDDGDLASYIQAQLKDGQLQAISELIQKQPEHIPVLLDLLQEEELPIQVKIGIGAVLEDLAGDPGLIAQIPLLTSLSESKDPALRGDATYYLSLTRHMDALPAIRLRLQDDNADVREIAEEALESFPAEETSRSRP